MRLVAGGFSNNATVRVSQTGQPDFLVTVAGGAYVWDVYVPASAAAGLITVTATDTSTKTSASTTYSVRSAATAPLSISSVSGDAQNGAPGAMLTKPLVVVVQDQDGNPAPGRMVTFAASPGAVVSPSTATTASDGTASTTLRLPPNGGIALATAQAGHAVVTLSAVSAAYSLATFPALTQAVDGTLGNGTGTIRAKGALLTAAASVLRYYQQIGTLPQPNGLASPASLNTFLQSFCDGQICDGFIALGSTMEQTINLWRVGAYVGGLSDVRVDSAALSHVRDLVASGSPVILALSLASGGSHFVTAIGIAADGSILIADPSPDWAQTNLTGYLNGFTAATGSIKATVVGAVRLVPNAPARGSFLVVANVPVNLASASGTCGTTLQFPDTAASAGVQLSATPGTLYFLSCDGSSAPYQLDITAPGPHLGNITGLVTVSGRADLSGSGPTSSLILLDGSQYALTPVTAAISAGGVVNAATFTSAIAPGEFISIFGMGFFQAVISGSGIVTSGGIVTNQPLPTVQINGQKTPVVFASAFQINAPIPFDVVAGLASLAVTAGSNTAQQSVTISAVAPAIFSTAAGQAAITNQDNTLNTASNPASRNSAIVIYATGLGAVTTDGGLSRANATVSVVIGGTEIPAAFAGLTPGFLGLYQVNIVLPATLPPGLGLPLYLKQAGTVSNLVSVSVQ